MSAPPVISVSALAQERTSSWVAQIEVSPCSLCRSRDRSASMLSLACRNLNCVQCRIKALCFGRPRFHATH